MGLDMYLTKKVYVGAEFEHRNVKVDINITVDGVPLAINPKRISYIEEAVGYWRKANAIHNWFVNNVQDGEDNCASYYVTREQLKELLNTVNEVLTHPELSVSLLPPQSGFFFGSTEIDEWYMQDLEDTKKIIETVLAEAEAEEKIQQYSDYYYRSSW